MWLLEETPLGHPMYHWEKRLDGWHLQQDQPLPQQLQQVEPFESDDLGYYGYTAE